MIVFCMVLVMRTRVTELLSNREGLGNLLFYLMRLPCDKSVAPIIYSKVRRIGILASWRSGYAEVCKTSNTSSILVGASNLGHQSGEWRNLVYAFDLKSNSCCRIVGSSPTSPTIDYEKAERWHFVV